MTSLRKVDVSFLVLFFIFYFLGVLFFLIFVSRIIVKYCHFVV